MSLRSSHEIADVPQQDNWHLTVRIHYLLPPHPNEKAPLQEGCEPERIASRSPIATIDCLTSNF